MGRVRQVIVEQDTEGYGWGRIANDPSSSTHFQNGTGQKLAAGSVVTVFENSRGLWSTADDAGMPVELAGQSNDFGLIEGVPASDGLIE